MRILAKTICWRVIATLTTGAIAHFTTGSFELAYKIAIGEFLVKSVIFYVHEIIWEKGRK